MNRLPAVLAASVLAILIGTWYYALAENCNETVYADCDGKGKGCGSAQSCYAKDGGCPQSQGGSSYNRTIDVLESYKYCFTLSETNECVKQMVNCLAHERYYPGMFCTTKVCTEHDQTCGCIP